MSRRLVDKYWEIQNKKPVIPVPSKLPKKSDFPPVKPIIKVHQVECNDEININKWLKAHPDIEIVDMHTTFMHEETIITVIYKTDIDRLEEETTNE